MDIDLRTLERIQDLHHMIESIKVSASKTTRTRKSSSNQNKEGKKDSSDSKRF